MSSRSLRSVALSFFLGLFLFSAPSAHAQQAARSIVDAVQKASKLQAELDRTLFSDLEKAIAEMGNQINVGMGEDERMRQENLGLDAIDDALAQTLLATPAGMMRTSLYETALMEARYRELNHVTPNQKNIALARGLPDMSGGSIASDTANFRVFMDFFCDPDAIGGEMGKITDLKKDNYTYSCGKSRLAILGQPSSSTAAAIGNAQLTGLPLKPHLLFFEPQTFPVTPISNETDKDGFGHTSKLADLTFGAYMYFQRLVFGKPSNMSSGIDFNQAGSAEAYVAEQSNVTRQMLAAYPFARLFSERMGTMGPDVAEAAADYMVGRWAGAMMDPTVELMAKKLRTSPSLSWAEYSDIVMNKALMAPGYFQSIDRMRPEQLQREKLYLMSLQNVLRYRINSWMEIRTAISAVQP